MSAQFIAILLSVGLVGAAVAGAADTRASDAIPGATSTMGDSGSGNGLPANACRVDVIRTGTPGSANVARQVLNNGRCVCIVTTGAAQSNGSAEAIVDALLRDRSCEGAPLAAATGANSVTGGASGMLLPALIGGVAITGLIVSLGKSSKG
ncbi:MAG: hypothetical protein KGM49_09955 [Sphingomonadales bacterium]|nr:hypothetical protein [Sphingomonadales bacterium]